MTHSTHLSDTSVSCPQPADGLHAVSTPRAFVGRFQWRPSRWMVCALLALMLLAPLAVLQSGLPRILAWPVCAGALGYAAELTRRECSQARRLVVVPTGAGPVTVDGRAIEDVQVQWRGPLAFLRWNDENARAGYLAWWPDTLPAARRRELKLAMQAREAARPAGSMAP